MSTPWVVALGVLTTLLAALGWAVVLMLGRVRELESDVSRLRRSLDAVRRGAGREPTPPPPPASSVVVMLEPERDSDRALLADLVEQGGPNLSVPTTVYVPDDGTGAAMVDGTGVEAQVFFRERPLSAGFPTVVVLGAQGAVLRTGSPARVRELSALVSGTHVHTHVPA